MLFDIDIAIFICFLSLNLIVGLFYGRGIRNIKEYAVGNRDFSTGTLSSTIVATWIGGGFFSFLISKVYSDGIYYVLPILMDYVITFFIIGFFLSSRMGDFLGKVSVAEAMGDIYGQKVRIVTAIAGFLAISGLIGIQFKVAAQLYGYFFNVPGIYAMLATSIIVVIYSSFGGIKSVTFTDVIQFFTFGTLIPIICFLIWKDSNDITADIMQVLDLNPHFSLEGFKFDNPKFIDVIQLALIFVIPALHPSVFQRISMAKSVKQVRKSFLISSGFSLLIVSITCSIGVLILAINPNLEPDKVWLYIIDTYSSGIGMKGFIIIGITAMIMSTADSYINSASVLVAHDIYGALGRINKEKELFISKLVSFLIGIVSILLALSTTDMLSLMLIANNFYIPVVTVPLIFTIFGIRSRSDVVIIAMVSGAVAVILWRCYFMEIFKIDSIIPGSLVNLVFFLGGHYLLVVRRRPNLNGSCITKELKKNRLISRHHKNFFNKINFAKIFNFNSSLPRDDYTYSVFGVFCIVNIMFNVFSLPNNLVDHNPGLIQFLYHTVLVLSSIILSIPVLPSIFKRKSSIGIIWVITLAYVLIFVPTTFVIVSNLGQLQLMIFMVNIIVASILVKWRIALFVIVTGVGISVIIFKQNYIFFNIKTITNYDIQFKIMYCLILLTSVLIAFLRPKQDYQELTEERNKHLNGRIVAKDKEVQEALALKGEFIRNVQHEYHTPMTGIISLSEGLLYSYDQLTDEEKREYLKDIVQNSHKLQAFDENITTLSLLSKPHYRLEREDIALNDLIYERVQICRKLYDQNNDDREFTLDLEDNIIISADRSYIIQLLDNLLINAIQYCKKGLIRINLSDDKINAVFTVSDEGIGVPKLELFEIFNPFTVSSKTRTPSGGRGVGLAVCRRIAEVHGGEITAESDGKKGAKFTIKLPLNKV